MKNLMRPSREVQTLFNQEWKRAKKVCKPTFDHNKKPHLYVAKQVRRNLGTHYGRDGLHSIKIGKRWVRNPHVIVLRIGQDIPRLTQTIRHEICHVAHQNHGMKFKNLLRGLERE